MSVHFGIWNQDGKPVDPEYLEKVHSFLAPYGPDSRSSYCNTSIALLFHAFYTTQESRRESQPCLTPSGAVIAWDGRLDNRAELARQLREVTTHFTDVSIVAAAYEKWGDESFARLTGDWAVSIWNPTKRSLILAKDPIGTRHLYYTLDNNRVTWSSLLDPLVLLAGRSFALNEEYIAGWMGSFPATHLTPYLGIHSVAPSCFVVVRSGEHAVRQYWDFDPSRRIRLGSDAEYEEHFRVIFGEAIRRRLRSDRPILAELSGGMDSSSIVCVADALMADGRAGTPRLDTISYYDDSEPNWNERPYFAKVEEKRKRAGHHIDVSTQRAFTIEAENGDFAATPGSIRPPSQFLQQFASCIVSQGNRVLLSGVGGDEVTGGVPTPTPELADLLARCRFKLLAHQLKLWALQQRRPWFHLLFDTARGFLPPELLKLEKHKRPAFWLDHNFVERNRFALIGYETRMKVFRCLPSFQENLSALSQLRRQIGCFVLPVQPTYEKCYPYLDRDLLEFLYAIPREQLVRPGQRRSLMRRALGGIVPDEILNRKRKAFAERTIIAANPAQSLTEIADNGVSASLGILNPVLLAEALQQYRHGHDIPVVPLLRTRAVESWLRNIERHGVWDGHITNRPQTMPHKAKPGMSSPFWPPTRGKEFS